MLFTRTGQTDDFCSTIQFPHAWMPNTEVRVHLHCIPMVTPASDQNVYLQYSYAWGNDANALPANSGWTTGNVTLTVPASGAKTFMIQMLPLFASTADVTYDESSFLVVNVKRLGTDPLDTYSTHKASGTVTANLAVLNIDAHYQVEKQGTPTEQD